MKTYLVTGASRGIGYVLAKHLLDRGDRVMTLSRTKPEFKLGSPSSWMARQIGWTHCDLASEYSVEQAIGKLSDWNYDGVVLNAALADKSVDQSHPDQMVKHMQVNFFGPQRLWHLMWMAGLINDPCNVVLMSSFLQGGNVTQPAYAASKAALWSWMRSYTMQQSVVHSVSMNMLWPGRVVTPANPHRELPETDPNVFRYPAEIIPNILNLLDQSQMGPRGTVVDLGRS